MKKIKKYKTNSEEVITSFDLSLKEIIVALSKGNIGAVTALMALAKTIPAEELYMKFLALDANGVHADKIWMLFKECDEDASKFAENI